VAVGDSVEGATEKLQRAVNKVNNWTKKWLIKLNEAKLVHVYFTNKRCQHIPITINDKVIAHLNTVKYLGMMLDTKLRWKAHVKKKCKELGLKYKKMYWLVERRLALSIHSKLMCCTNNIEACVARRHTAVGMQHRHHSVISKQGT
jgi:hypothetical protein